MPSILNNDIFDRIYLDASTSDFPGITWSAEEKRLFGPRLNDETHPHLQLEKAMVSVPHVEPGDMVFWHCVSDIFVLFTINDAKEDSNLEDRTSYILLNPSITVKEIRAVLPIFLPLFHPTVLHSDAYHSVMYIPAVPTTLANKDYISRQAKAFLGGVPPPDFPQDTLPETGNKGLGVESDVVGEAARRAMGLVEG
jgi:hypothetical protein